MSSPLSLGERVRVRGKIVILAKEGIQNRPGKSLPLAKAGAGTGVKN